MWSTLSAVLCKGSEEHGRVMTRRRMEHSLRDDPLVTRRTAMTQPGDAPLGPGRFEKNGV